MDCCLSIKLVSVMSFDLILQNVGRHIELSEEEVNYFTSILRPKKIPRKQFLLKAGDRCMYESFVNKGCLRVYSIDAKGVEHINMFTPEDWWVSDMYSFLTQTPATYYIDALEDSELFQIEKNEQESLFEKIPKFNRLYRILLQNAFIANQQRIAQNLSFSAEQRFDYFLKKYPQIEQRIPQKQVASFLGITPEFLSMLRRKKAKG